MRTILGPPFITLVALAAAAGACVASLAGCSSPPSEPNTSTTEDTTGASTTVGSSSGGSGGAGGGTSSASSSASSASSGAGAGGAEPVQPFCAPGKYILCEDFEATAPGAIPQGWTKDTGAVSVAEDQAFHGKRSLKIETSGYGRRIRTSASRLGGEHWGRIFYRVQEPVPSYFVHSTIVALQGIGPVNGSEEVRVVDTVKAADGSHQFLYNVQPSGQEFGKGSAYDWKFDGAWHCAEWHIDGATQSYHFYFEGVEVTSIAIDNGPGNYKGSDIPMSFGEIMIGWNQYQNPPANYPSNQPSYFTTWVDELAVDAQRIGCK